MLQKRHGRFLFSKLWVLVFFAVTARVQAQRYHFIRYSVEDGLAQSQISCIGQDSRGYMWFGTVGGGLNRFDGIEFEGLSHDEGLLDNQVNTVINTTNGGIWIGVKGGVSQHHPQNTINYHLPDFALGSNVTALATDSRGILWIGTDRNGLFYLSGKKIVQYDRDHLPAHIRCLEVCEDNLYIGTQEGLRTVGLNDHLTKQILLDTLHTPKISDIVQDGHGRLWVSSLGNGIYLLQQGKVQHFGMTDGLVRDWIRALCLDKNGNLWCASKYGISQINTSDKNIRFKTFDKGNGLYEENITSLFCDREGILWIGSDGGGVMQFAGESFVSYNSANGLSGDIIMSILFDHRGRQWYATYGMGITMYDGTFHYYQSADGVLPNNTVWCLLEASDHSVWAGTSDGVAVIKDGRLTTISDSANRLHTKVTALFEDRNGNIWCGTKSGVYRWWHGRLTHPSAFEGHLMRNVRSIIQSGDGAIWFGTSEGVFRYDGALTQYTTNNHLPDNTVYCMQTDGKGHLWMGTKNGLCIFDGRQFRAVKISKDYSDNFTNFLLCHNHKLWIGSNNGLFSFDLDQWYRNDTVVVAHFNTRDGLVSPECNLNAVRLHQNKIWFGTSQALISYDMGTQTVASGRVPPLIHITGIRLFMTKGDLSKYADNTDTVTGLPHHLQLPYKQNHVTFDFVGISTGHPSEIRYRFRLVGFDDHWLDGENNRFATYSNLHFGDYRFEVIAINRYGIRSAQAASFSFSIMPPFWRTWWFYCLCVVVAGSTVWLINIWRIRRRNERDEKKRLTYQWRMLRLEQQSLNASMNRHFVFNALNSIQYYINKNDEKAANTYLGRFAQLIRLNLDSSQKDRVPLSDEIKRLKLYLSLEHMRFQDKFDYNLDIEEMLDDEQIQVPAMLLQPFVENSIVHGLMPKETFGKVEVKIWNDRDKNRIACSIIDDGVGLRDGAADEDDGHNSHGLNLCRARIDLLRKMSGQGRITIDGPKDLMENDRRVGTVVHVLIDY